MSQVDNLDFQPVFSRENPDDEVIYVQHQMACESQLVHEAVFGKNGWFFIAGNAKQMPDAVTQALKDALEKHGGLSSDEANAYVNKMEATKRFQTETWS